MIKVTDVLYIDVQDIQYVVFEKTDKKDKQGKDIFTNYSYAVSLEQAMSICIRRELAKELSDKVVDLQEAMQLIKDIHERFEKILKKEVRSYEKIKGEEK